MSDFLAPQSPKTTKNYSGLKIAAVILTIFGFLLFFYLVFYVGFDEILEGIGKIGFLGFALILFIHLIRIIVRAIAWKLSVSDPHKVSFSDTFQGVLIGEAVSSVIPLGIVASGTSKAVAISNRVSFVVGLSSVATENLFYSFVTSLFIISGAFVFLFMFDLEYYWVVAIYGIIAILSAAIIFGFLMVFREWRWVSFLCDHFLNLGFFPKFFETIKSGVHTFEDNILEFYRTHSDRFVAISVCQVVYHVCGIAEIMFVLSKISENGASFSNAYLLESVSRVITIVFKLIPFAAGVDEASSQFISENLALGVGVGVTIAILRKARILFWALVGMLLILKRELSIKSLLNRTSE
jgi:Lysylphosphatidylglycerol synthase TM region